MFEAVAVLKWRLRRVFELRHSQGLTYQQIAEAMEMPIGSVRSSLHRAVQAVRARVAEKPGRCSDPC